MKILTFMGESYHLLDPNEEKFYEQLKRQFGKKDADHIMISPSKFSHQFDEQTLKSFDAIFTEKEIK
jgi:hypothetical protein